MYDYETHARQRKEQGINEKGHSLTHTLTRSCGWPTATGTSQNTGFSTEGLALVTQVYSFKGAPVIVQELCESRGGRPGLSVLTSLLLSVDVKQY